MELYYGIVLRDYSMESYHRIMLQKHIMETKYGVILQNDIMELYYGIILMKRIPRMPRTSLEPPGIPGIPWARPWDPRGPPWDTPGTSGDHKAPHGRQKQPYLHKHTAPEALDCCVQTCLFEPIAWRTPTDRFIYRKAAKLRIANPPVPGFPGGVYG